MKTKLLTLFAIILSVGMANAQNQKPDLYETKQYIEKIMTDASSNYLFYDDGERAKIYVKDWFSINVIHFSTPYGDSETYRRFTEMDWAKVIKIDDENYRLMSSSPVKYIEITFPQNSVLYTYKPLHSAKIESNASVVMIPYLNQEGVRDRLIKAIQHLVELSKTTADVTKANDPFAN